MNVVIVGAGYVGLGTAAMLAHLGHHVTGIDVNADRIGQLRRGEVPIYEPGLDRLLLDSADNLTWTTSFEAAIPEADVIFMCVGTPSRPDGRPDVTQLEQAVRSVAPLLNGKPQLIVNKSTVPVGTGDWLTGMIDEHTRPGHGLEYWVISNPEFLREGTALTDSLYPDRIVLGGHPVALRRMRELYDPLITQEFTPPAYVPRPPGYTAPAVVETTLASAEMIKYAANAFLALKISFANEIAGLCERVGADITEVATGIGLDRRIGPSFLAAGAGWGGSCFGKDTSALISTGGDYGYDMPILRAAIDVNYRQRDVVLQKLQRHLRILKGKRVAVLGMAFKPNTDDLRDAPAHDFIARLNELGATVIAHDPAAMPRAREEWTHLSYREAPGAAEALRGADAVIVATEWDEYRQLDWDALLPTMRHPLVIDARNILILPVRTHAYIEQIGRDLSMRPAVMTGVES